MPITQALTAISNKDSRVPAIAVFLLAILLGLSSLNRGLQSDDYIHRSMLSDEKSSFNQNINGFFEFLGPTEHIPWWTQEDLKIKFWRPLSAVSHWLDYQLWPEQVWLMHLHNVVWYALLSLLVLAFFKRILYHELALLAAFLFCIDFSHFANISWIANRNSLISACCILASFIFYLDWREQQKLKAFFLSIGFFLLALLSGEAGFSLLAIILAYELAFTKGSIAEHKILRFYLLAALFFVLGIFWFYFYQQAGFGSANNSMYFSPTSDPLANVQLILQKIPVFLFSAIFGIDGFYNVFPHEIKLVISIVCACAVIMVFVLLRRQLYTQDFLFLFLASMGVLVPVSLVAVVDMRLGLLASIFSTGIVGLLLQSLIKSEYKGVLGKSFLIYLVFVHVALAALQWMHVGVRDAIDRPDSFTVLKKLHLQYPDKDIFLLNHPSPIDVYYFPFVLDATKDNQASKIHVLTNNFSNYRLTRLKEDRLVIENTQGLVFKNNDFLHYSLDEKPIQHGVYARSAFNSILSRNFQFQKQQQFNHALYKVTIIDVKNELKDNAKTEGMASRIQIDFLVRENKRIFLIWESKTRTFKPLDDLLEQNESLDVVNWIP